MIYDVHTKNKSFLRISKYLRDHNVKNNKFMLVLYDNDLVGIDPYDFHLSKEMQFKIYREICRNVWYFIREVIKIPADGADIPYELNLGNATLTYLKELNKNFIEIMPRQHGKTMGEIIYDTWNLCFVAKNANIVYLNKGKPDAVKNLKIFKDVRSLLPKWMLEEYIEDPKKDIDNQEYKTISRRNNTLKVVAPGTDEDEADKKGRGLTVSNIYWDEFSFTKYNDITYQACLPAWKKAAENAKKHGSPYGITLTTTPANLDTPAGAYCYDMIDKAAKWNITLFDLTPEQLDVFVEENSQNNYIFVQYTYKELGRSEQWLKEMIRDCNGDIAKVKREILLEWPRSTDSSVFSEDQLDKIYTFIRPATSHIMVKGLYPVDFYEAIDPNLNYILSCDVAGGLSHDNSVINIIHPEDFRIVGDFRSNKADTNTFKGIIRELMTFFFRNSLLVIERNSYGLNIIQDFMKDPAIEPRMYRETKDSLGEKTLKDGFVVKKKTNKVAYGVDTNAITRKQMFDMLPEIVETEYDKFVSPNIFKDLSTLERKKTGKIEHSASGHDDSLMAYLIFRWAVFYGKCFRDKFGISPMPSRMNVRVVSNSTDLLKFQSMMQMANDKAEARSVLEENPTYSFLAKQEKILNPDENQQVNAFLRIASFNTTD